MSVRLSARIQIIDLFFADSPEEKPLPPAHLLKLPGGDGILRTYIKKYLLKDLERMPLENQSDILYVQQMIEAKIKELKDYVTSRQVS